MQEGQLRLSAGRDGPVLAAPNGLGVNEDSQYSPRLGRFDRDNGPVPSVPGKEFCMHLRSSLWTSVALSLLVVGSTALAEGRGQGLNRALAAAARGSSNSGLARAGQSAARSQNGLSRGGANLGRSANGLNRASSGISHSQALGAQTSNATRIRDKRLQQADHLREISARNGNERLLDTADRMQDSAQRNYDRGVGEAGTEGPETENVGATVRQSAGGFRPAPAATPATNPRSSWLPAWLRTSP